MAVNIGSVALALGAFGHRQGDTQTTFQPGFNAIAIPEWDIEPDIDTTGHHLFNSVSSLLQLWPNTVVRPGECSGQTTVDARRESFLTLTTITGA